jgi:hypothetical protein
LIATVRVGPLLIRGVRLVESIDRRGWALEWPMVKNEAQGYFEDVVSLGNLKVHHQVLAALLRTYYNIKVAGETVS